MKAANSMMKLRRFEIEEKQNKVTDIEMMISDFARQAADLGRQIEMEEKNSGITDPNHFSYPPFAKAAITRRENLETSVKELQTILVTAKEEFENANEELKKLEARYAQDSKISASKGGRKKRSKDISPARQLQLASR